MTKGTGITDEEAGRLLQKFRTGVLTVDEDIALERWQEHRNRSKRVSNTTLRKSMYPDPLIQVGNSFIRQSEVQEAVNAAVKKALHLDDSGEQALRGVRDALRAASAGMDKIDFEGRTVQGSMRDRDVTTDANAPSKAAGRIPDREYIENYYVGSALINGPALYAMTRPEFRKQFTVAPARPESENPGIPGKPMTIPGDAGGAETVDQVRARLGENPREGELAQAAFRAAKPMVISSRGGW